MRNWQIKWGTTGVALVVADSLPAAAEIFTKRYASRYMGDSLIKSIEEVPPFHIISADATDVPF